MDIEQIVELDKNNMSAILKKLSLPFNAELRKKGLEKDIKDGAKFITIERNNKIIAYIEYIINEDNICNIKSIQIHSKYQSSYVLGDMLVKSYMELQNNCPSYIYSFVHKNNKAALTLYLKLGFQNIDEVNERINFKISGKELLKNIKFMTDSISNQNVDSDMI